MTRCSVHDRIHRFSQRKCRHHRVTWISCIRSCSRGLHSQEGLAGDQDILARVVLRAWQPLNRDRSLEPDSYRTRFKHYRTKPTSASFKADRLGAKEISRLIAELVEVSTILVEHQFVAHPSRRQK